MKTQNRCGNLTHRYKFLNSGEGHSCWVCEECGDVIIENEDSQP